MIAFLDFVEQFLRQEIAPYAAEIDQHPATLRSAFQALGDRNWLALRVPEIWGGAGIDSPTFQQFQEQIARYSGALAFLQTQHQSAGSFLSRSENESLKQTYLPKMGRGEITIGVGFSHLRRSGESPLKGYPVAGGYILDGQIPWVTGFEIFQAVVVAAVLPDQQAVYGLVPFQTMQQPRSGQIRFGLPMAMAAMPATNTVMAELHQWFLPDSQVVLIQSRDGLAKSDIANVLQPSFFALGCAQAALDVMEKVCQGRSQTASNPHNPTTHSTRFPISSTIQTAHHSLAQELHQCRQAIFSADPLPYKQKLTLRAWALELAVRCAHAAVTASSGQANLLNHPAQRIYREALVFTVTGQTPAIMEATLARLTRDFQAAPLD
jgi:alkylation response protein AidB-like acyl-CoA dehydrogenase